MWSDISLSCCYNFSTHSGLHTQTAGQHKAPLFFKFLLLNVLSRYLEKKLMHLDMRKMTDQRFRKMIRQGSHRPECDNRINCRKWEKGADLTLLIEIKTCLEFPKEFRDVGPYNTCNTSFCPLDEDTKADKSFLHGPAVDRVKIGASESDDHIFRLSTRQWAEFWR